MKRGRQRFSRFMFYPQRLEFNPLTIGHSKAVKRILEKGLMSKPIGIPKNY